VVYRDQQSTASPPTTPPSIITEIISEDHPFANVLEALHEYQQWGVPHIWVIDPWLRKLQQYSQSLLKEVTAFEIPGTDIRITLDQLTAGLPLN
jgi:Uma2 family endonuclease